MHLIDSYGSILRIHIKFQNQRTFLIIIQKKCMSRTISGANHTPVVRKQLLIQSIKKNIDTPDPNALKRGRPKSRVDNGQYHYESFTQTAIDYTKSHNNHVQYQDQQMGNHYDQTTAQFGANHHQEYVQSSSPRQNGLQYYDQNIMNEIQMELYNQQKNSNSYQTQSPILSNTTRSQKKNIPTIQELKKITTGNTSNSAQKNKQMPNQNRVIQSKTQITNKNLIKQPVRRTRNQSLSADKQIDLQNYHQEVQPGKKIFKPNNSSQPIKPNTALSQPVKRLNKSQPQNLKKQIKLRLKMTVFPAIKPVKKVIRCLSDNSDISDRLQAKFQVQLDGGEHVVVSNTEMIYLYKDHLIDYYQAIHFS